MRFNLSSFLALFIIVQVNQCDSASLLFDCSEVCDLDPEVSGKSVCGKNGITYSNECLAYCQVSIPIILMSH
jgi:hypothetical protein